MKNLLIYKFDNIRTAYKKLNLTAEKCLFVVDKNSNFIGTLSDGDIRKAIMKNFNLDNKIEKIYNKKPFYVNKNNININKVKKYILKENYNVVPVLENNKVIDYFNFAKLFEDKKINKKIPLPLVIMAGGKGTRLRPYSNILPKPLFPVNNKTIIEIIINKFLDYRINKIIITLNYRSSIIKSFFKELNLKHKIEFITEKKELGTAGSLQLTKKHIKSDFFVSNCDVIIDTDYYDIYLQHKKQKNDITLVVSTKEFTLPYGTCEITKSGNLKKLIEKPKFNYLLNCGFYLLNKKVIDLIPINKKFDFNELIAKALKNKLKISVYPIDDYLWNDIGQLKEYTNFLNNSE